MLPGRPPLMRRLLEIARTGLDSLVRYRLRSFVTVACLVAMLAPYVVGAGISQGVREQASDAIRFGADLYVSATELGRPAPIPTRAVGLIEGVVGVTRVAPRIVGG